ncbi:MAG: serine/threonine-protein kinase [Myxococcota bacterium]
MLPPLGYSELELIGQGATSRVYRAWETRTKRPVALKRLHRQLVKDDTALARMRRELEALSALRHPSIVAVFGVISWQGEPTIVMELIEGVDLKEHIQRSGRLDTAETERIGRALLDALAAAHAAGIVHRDVKPQNVRLAKDGRVVLLDFGSARLDAASALTTTGTTVGTPEYMAPELFIAPAYDPRTDLYGVGATLYECLSGKPPFLGDSVAELAFLKASQDTRSILLERPECSAALGLMIDRCLMRAPEHRFASASRAVSALSDARAERALARTRSRAPLCLHCAAEIPAESKVCPACASPRPFAYHGGAVDVFVTGVDDEERFLEYVLLRFPERATRKRIEALLEGIGAIGRTPLRYLSLLSETDAMKLVEELATVGVRAVARPAKSTIAAVILTAMVIQLFVFNVVRNLPWVDWAYGSESIQALVFGVIAGVIVNLFAVPALVASRISSGPADALGPGPRPQVPARSLPRGAWRERLLPTLTGGRMTKSLQRFGLGSQALTRVGLACATALIPTELYALNELGLFGTTPLVQVVTKRIAPTPTIAPVTPPVSPPASAPKPLRARRAPQRGEGLPIGMIMAIGGPAVLILALAMLARRRRRRDLARLLEQVDVAALLQRVRKQAPRYRHWPQRQALPALPGSDLSDPFLISQRVLAAELSHHLERADGETLERALAEIAAAVRAQPGALERTEDSSLLARAIRETDPDQALRFRLLALMGEMEAKAAASWAASLPGEDETK